MISGMKKLNFLLWIGIAGMIITLIVHAFFYFKAGRDISGRFNFYLVWVIFILLGILMRRR